MKKKFYETPEFESIHKEWELKLEASGFQDIEKSEDGYQLRKQIFDPDMEIKAQIEEETNKLSLEILANYKFDRDIDYVVFKLHTQGKTSREIADYLSRFSTKQLSFQQVAKILAKVKRNYILKGKS